MLQVFEKTTQEIENEERDNHFYAARVKGIAKPVCPYYLITKDGSRVDASDLSEKQILSFYIQALRKGIADEANNKFGQNGQLDSIAEASKLTQVLSSPYASYKPSYEGLKTVVELFEDDNPTIRSWAKDLLTPLVEKQVSEVETISKFLQESQGNFENPTKTQKLQVIDQLAKNEYNRQNQVLL